MTAKEDNWEKRFNEWRRKKKKKLNLVTTPVEKVVEEIKEVEKETIEYLKEPKHIKILKIIALLIPLIAVTFLTLNNFVLPQKFDYFYDIGPEGENYLTPAERVSTSFGDYKELTGGLVYFNIPIARGSDQLTIKTKLKDNFPEDQKISIGAKNKEEWHYLYKQIYNPSLEELSKLTRRDNVYLVNENLLPLSFEELTKQKNIIIATDKNYKSPPNVITDYKQKETIIDATLRGKHTFYIYIAGNLELEVKKQDLNWYENSDELEITITNTEGHFIADLTILDDGFSGVDKSTPAPIQKDVLRVNNLKEGVYKIEFKDFDGFIKEIKINTNKIVAESVFLADSEVYNLSQKTKKLYFTSHSEKQIKMLTYHGAGIQVIPYKINNLSESKSFFVDKEDKPVFFDLIPGDYELTFYKNDLIITSPTYLAFAKENYFEPFQQKVVPITEIEWLKNNVDYILTDYKSPTKEGEWLITETTFNIGEDDLFIENGELSLLFNTPHLSKEEFKNNTIPIDWIKTTVYKPGVFS